MLIKEATITGSELFWDGIRKQYLGNRRSVFIICIISGKTATN